MTTDRPHLRLVPKDGFREGPVAHALERLATRLPSGLFLGSAAAALVLAGGLRLMGKRDHSRFVAQWPATILLFGVYDQIVRRLGSDSVTAQPGVPIL